MKKLLLSAALMAVVVSCFNSEIYATEKRDTTQYKINQVVISAMRYPERIMEIPLAVSILNYNALQNTRGAGIDEALKMVPGVLAQTRAGGGDVRITIRGFGARGAGDRSNSGTSRGIKFILDGVPETEPDGRTAFDNLDLSISSNIEVLRSNASSIWGNAAGGVVSISTVPVHSGPFLEYDLLGGSFGFIKNTVKLGTNLDNGKIWGIISDSKADGYRQHSDFEKQMINLGLTSAIGTRTFLGVNVVGAINKFNIPGPILESTYDNSPDSANATYLSRRERRNNRTFRIGVNLDHQFDDHNAFAAMVFANPKYLQRSERGTYRDFNRYHIGGGVNYRNSSDFTEEFHNKFIAGFDNSYQDGAILFYALSADQGRSNTLSQNKKEGANSFGAFAQNEIVWNEKISFILGLRYDNISYYSQDFMKLNFKESRNFDHFTPKAGLTYRLSPEQSLYFNIGGGVEVPAGNETDPVPTFGQDSVFAINPLLDPIVSTTFEFGTKHSQVYQNSFVHALNYDMAVFYISTENEIIPYSGGKFYFSAGKTSRIGVELGLSTEFDYGLSFNAAFTYMNSKYNEYKIDSVHYKKPGAYADYKDNKIPGIPELFSNYSIRYAPDYFKFFVELSAQTVGSYFVDDANKYEVPSYNIINASIGLSEPIMVTNNIGFRVYAAANNLTDQKYIGSAFINPDLDKKTNSPYYIETGLPQNFTIGFNMIIK